MLIEKAQRARHTTTVADVLKLQRLSNQNMRRTVGERSHWREEQGDEELE
jgi:hypothetical protein